MSEELQNAMKARDEFLEKHPHLQSYQDEIDRVLDASGNNQGRMNVLATLMQAKLLEMQKELSKLQVILLKAISENETSV